MKDMMISMLVVAAMSVGCSAQDEPQAQVGHLEEPPEPPEEGVPNRYYAVTRADTRRCDWPACGGFFIELANQDLIECADGTWGTECYVSAIDTSRLWLSNNEDADLRGAMLDYGVIFHGLLQRVGDRDELSVREAHRRITDLANGPLLYVLGDGPLCSDGLCASFDVASLNFSGSDWADRVQLEPAFGAAAHEPFMQQIWNRGAIVVGTFEEFDAMREDGTMAIGTKLIAKAGWELVVPVDPIEPEPPCDPYAADGCGGKK